MRNLFIATVLCVAFARAARGAFVDGVERFDGTSLDLTTWERYNPAVSTFSQNDSLTISGNGSYGVQITGVGA